MVENRNDQWLVYGYSCRSFGSAYAASISARYSGQFASFAPCRSHCHSLATTCAGPSSAASPRGVTSTKGADRRMSRSGAPTRQAWAASTISPSSRLRPRTTSMPAPQPPIDQYRSSRPALIPSASRSGVVLTTKA